MTDPTGTAEMVAEAASRSDKPVLAAWMGGLSVAAAHELLNHAGLPTYDSPDRAIRAFMYLVTYQRNREILYETPRQMPMDKSLNVKMARDEIRELVEHRRQTLTEVESKGLLAAFGVPTTIPLPAYTPSDAVSIACDLGYPVVLKIHSPQIVHKTEVRGVVTGVSTDEEVRRVFDEIVRACPAAAARRRYPRRHRPADGFLGRRRRADRRRQAGSGVRRGDDGRRGGDYGRGAQGPGPRTAAAQRTPGPTHDRIAAHPPTAGGLPRPQSPSTFNNS